MSSGLPKVEIPFERFGLRCGATLLVSPRKGAPVTALHIHMRGGHSLDPADKLGLAFLVGSLADQGTERRSEEEIATLLEPAGGSLGGDSSGITGSIVAGEWELLCELACDVLTEPTYPREKFARHRERLVDRLLLEEDDPRVQGERHFRRLVYGEHWLGRAAQGTPASVRALRRADLVLHHREHWVGRRTLIAICGDVEPARVARFFERRLARWNPGQAFEPSATGFPPRAVRTQAFVAERQQVHLYLGHLGVPRMHPDYDALVVMDHVLGTGPGFTNRVAMKLRDELGLAYTVNASIHGSAGVLPGAFCAYIGTSPEHARTAVEGFRAEMRRIRDEPVSVEELATAVNYLLGAFAIGYQRSSRRAGWLILSERHGFPPDHLERLPEVYAAIGVADVQRVARAHLFPEHCVLASAGPIDARALAELGGATSAPAGAARRASARRRAPTPARRARGRAG